MYISCPSCRTRFRFDEQKVSGSGIKLRCSKCSSVFRLAAEKSTNSGRLSVLVAHESAEFCNAVQKVLAPEPFDIISCHDGKEALDLTFRFRPDVVLLNVALPTMYGFQVSEALRGDARTAGIKIILLAAIYDKTKYKRSPQTLYGADDYIEQHHIPDSLAPMIYRLASDAKEVESANGAPETEKEIDTSAASVTAKEANDQEEVRKELKADQPAEVRALTDEAYRSARRLARSIVSDISLYREAELEEAVRTEKVDECLGIEIRDGRAIYESRLPEAASYPVDFFEEALSELIIQKKREMGIAQDNEVTVGSTK
jgi:predicted Zn finger-like uncharacterized protein